MKYTIRTLQYNVNAKTKHYIDLPQCQRYTSDTLDPLYLPAISSPPNHISNHGIQRKSNAHAANTTRSRHGQCARISYRRVPLLPLPSTSSTSNLPTSQLTPQPRNTEYKPKLLRTLRPQARHISKQQRTDVLHDVHGKVHEHLERGQ